MIRDYTHLVNVVCFLVTFQDIRLIEVIDPLLLRYECRKNDSVTDYWYFRVKKIYFAIGMEPAGLTNLVHWKL